MSEGREVKKGITGLSITGALLGAVGASLCCGGPLVLIIAGTGGACISSLRFLAPYRPYFVALSLLSLGVAWYAVFFRKPKGPTGAYCRFPRLTRYSKPLLVVATIIVIGLILFPYLVR
ncbi:MAG: mercury transporter MerT [Deltaproteobacteria bacterium]|nr:MAG: mercury transporter MerT [Deltaproteobacteria bacterium]